MKAIVPVATPVLVELVDGQPTTTSLDVAAHFGKLHKTVLRAIANLECSPEFTQRNFVPSEYTDSTGRKLTQYRMTRDGFTFLCMGFTGKEAAKWKEAYISAFNKMEAALQQGSPAKAKRAPKALPNGLSTDQQNTIKTLVKARVESLPKEKQAKAAITCWSALKSKFGCSYKKIESDQFAEAVGLVARIELEGEWLGKEPEPGAITLGQLDLAMLYTFSSAAMQLCEMGEKFKPVMEAMRSLTLFGVDARLETCRLVVGHLHGRIGAEMEAAARQEGLFDEWMDLSAANDRNRAIINLNKGKA